MNLYTSNLKLMSEQAHKLYGRDYTSAELMSKELINRINALSTKMDTLYVIGGLFNYAEWDPDSWEAALQCVKEIKPDVYLVLGDMEAALIRDKFSNDLKQFLVYCQQHKLKTLIDGNCTIKDGPVQFEISHDYWKAQHPELLCLYAGDATGYPLTPYGVPINADLNNYYPVTAVNIIDSVTELLRYPRMQAEFQIVDTTVYKNFLKEVKQ